MVLAVAMREAMVSYFANRADAGEHQGQDRRAKKMMKDLNVCHTNPAYNPDYSGGEMDGGNDEISGDVF